MRIDKIAPAVALPLDGTVVEQNEHIWESECPQSEDLALSIKEMVANLVREKDIPKQVLGISVGTRENIDWGNTLQKLMGFPVIIDNNCWCGNKGCLEVYLNQSRVMALLQRQSADLIASALTREYC